MKQIETRCFLANKDYDWFSNSFESNFDLYENLKCSDSGEYSVFLEIDVSSKKWKVFVEKFKSSRVDAKKRGINFRLRGEGLIGDQDSQFFYNLLSYLFNDLTGISHSFAKISQKLDSIFPESLISDLYDRRTDIETQKVISQKLNGLVDGLQFGKEVISEKISPEFIVNKAYNTTNLDIFRRRLSNLISINQETSVDVISLVYADIEVSKNTADKLFEGLSDNKTIGTYIITARDSSLILPYQIEVKKKSISNPKMRKSINLNSNSSNTFGTKSSQSTSCTESNIKKNGEVDLKFKFLKSSLIGLGIGLIIGLMIGTNIKANKSEIQKLNKTIDTLNEKISQLESANEILSINNDKLLTDNNVLRADKKASLENTKREMEEKLEALKVSCDCMDVKTTYINNDDYILHTDKDSNFILHYRNDTYKEIGPIQKESSFTPLSPEENKYVIYMNGEFMIIENKDAGKFYKLGKVN